MVVFFPFLGKSLGGSHVTSVIIAKELKKHGHNVLVGVFNEGELTKYLDANGLNWKKIDCVREPSSGNGLAKILSVIYNLSGYRRFLGRNKIDVVHTNESDMHISWVLPAFFCKCKHVWHQHSVSGKAIYFSLFSDAVLTVSEFCKVSFPWFAKKRAVIVSNPVELQADVSYYYSRRRIKKQSDVINIAWVGNLLDHKRPVVAVDVIASLKFLMSKKVFLYVFGDPEGEERDCVLKRIEKHSLQDRVIFMGLKSPIEEWVCGCDFLLSTSVNEGMGRAVVESMLLRVPVVASAHGGHLEIIENNKNGVLVDPCDVEAFAKEINGLDSSDLFKEQMLDNAEEYAKQSFSTSVFMSKIIKIYMSLLPVDG